jgi:hypothetical protein
MGRASRRSTTAAAQLGHLRMAPCTQPLGARGTFALRG